MNEVSKPRELRAMRRRAGVKRQRNTLTQMDFLRLKEYQGEDGVGDGIGDGEEGLGTITSGGGFEQLESVEAGQEDVDPDTEMEGERVKRRKERALEGGADGVKGKRRRKIFGGSDVDDRGWSDETPILTHRRWIHGRAFSEREPNRGGLNTTVDSTPRTTRATTNVDAEKLQAEPHQQISSDDKENLSPSQSLPRFAAPRTPERKRDVIPSSQSPESVSISSRKRPSFLSKTSNVSTLRERSANVTHMVASRTTCMPGLILVGKGLSPKRTICILKYGPGRFRRPELPEDGRNDVIVKSSTTSQFIKDARGHVEDRTIAHAVERGGDGIARKLLRNPTEPEIQETSQIDASEVISSSQTDTEEDEEIPETSQGLRRFISASSANKSEESLKLLSEANRTPSTVKKARRREGFDQFDHVVLAIDVHMHDVGSSYEDEGTALDHRALAISHNVIDNTEAASRSSAQLSRKESAASTIADSQTDEDADEDIPLCLQAFTANEIESSSNQTRRRAKASTTTGQPQSPVRNSPSSPTLPPAPPHTTCPSATTTRIPTKLPPSSSSSSSPPVPPPQPTAHRRPSTTQQSIRPASMTRPSQVSTQSPTQQSWLPMSSMPYAQKTDTVLTSSPNHDHVHDGDVEHVTIKDSSSQVVQLRDVPSQSQVGLSRFPLVNLGLDNNRFNHDDDDDDAPDGRDDGDLDPKSSPLLPVFPKRERQAEAAEGDLNMNSESSNEGLEFEAAARAHPNLDPGAQDKGDEAPDTTRRVREAPPPTLPPPPLEVACTSSHRPRRFGKRKSQNQLQAQPPRRLSRLHLPDSLLESLPGPPGWAAPPISSQGSGEWEAEWDDRML